MLEWTIRGDSKGRDIERVGWFTNSGDRRTTAMISMSVFAKGAQVPNLNMTLQSKIMDYPVNSDVVHKAGPVINLHAEDDQWYQAILDGSLQPEISVEFAYPNGLGNDLRLENRIKLLPGLKIGVLLNQTLPVRPSNTDPLTPFARALISSLYNNLSASSDTTKTR